MKRLLWAALSGMALLQVGGMAGCYVVSPSHGGGQTAVKSAGHHAADVAVPAGYRVSVVAEGLTFPTGVAFDESGKMYVVESGYSWGEKFATPRLLRVTEGKREVVAAGKEGLDGPWTGVAFYEGNFYVADGRETGEGGRVLRIGRDGRVETLIDHLPSVGDHHVNGPAVSAAGEVYFGIGTATNSGVVGTDNAEFGWLPRHSQFHDIPGREIVLRGENFESPDPLHPGGRAWTGAYVPFGQTTRAGQRVAGQVPCTGGVFRIPARGGPVELVAWGLRNPFGLTVGGDGVLFATENSYDVRGSRPVWGTGDTLWRIDPRAEMGKWYGWPDYFDGQPLDTPKRFTAPGKERPRLLLAEPPNDPPRPTAIFGVHASANGLDAAPASFGHGGELFVAEFGDMAPEVGKVMSPVGYCVVRVDPKSGVIEPFAVNRSSTGKNGPASKLGTGGLERPVSVKFGPDGAMYVVDFGVMTMTEKGPAPREGTGAVWRIAREGGR